MKSHTNIFTTLFFCLTFLPLTANAILVSGGDIVSVGFDLSAETPAPPFEGIYTSMAFGASDYLNMNEGFTIGVFDDGGQGLDDGTGYFLLYDVVGSFDLTDAWAAGRIYSGGFVSTDHIAGTISSLATLPDLGDALAMPFTFINTGSESISWFGHDRLLLPSAVPEPASIALLGLGLVGLGFARRKRVV